MVGIITLNQDTFTNPTLYSIIKKLNEEGIPVIIFSAYQEALIPIELNLTTYATAPKGLALPRRPLNLLKYISSTISVALKIKRQEIKHIIAVDPFGLVLAGRIWKLLKFKIHYFSFEIFFKEEISEKKIIQLKNEEIRYTGIVNSILIQDKKRKELLSIENMVSKNFTNWHLIPVSPNLNKAVGVSNYNKTDFGFKKSDIVYVHSGSVDIWSGIETIIKAIENGLPENTFIFIHNRSKFDSENPHHKRLVELVDLNYPVILHDAHFQSYEDYCAFLKCFDYGITIYKSDNGMFTGKNLKEIGLSSGKFSTFMSVGLPTVLSECTTYIEILQKFKVGVIANEKQDLSYHIKNNSLKDITDVECLNFYSEVLNPEKKIDLFINNLKTNS